MNIAAHNPKFLNGLSITRLLTRIAILTSQLDGAKKQITTMTSQIMDLTSQNTAYLQRINELERSATLDSVGQRMQKLLTTNDLAGILRLKPIQE